MFVFQRPKPKYVFIQSLNPHAKANSKMFHNRTHSDVKLFGRQRSSSSVNVVSEGVVSEDLISGSLTDSAVSNSTITSTANATNTPTTTNTPVSGGRSYDGKNKDGNGKTESKENFGSNTENEQANGVPMILPARNLARMKRHHQRSKSDNFAAMLQNKELDHIIQPPESARPPRRFTSPLSSQRKSVNFVASLTPPMKHIDLRDFKEDQIYLKTTKVNVAGNFSVSSINTSSSTQDITTSPSSRDLKPPPTLNIKKRKRVEIEKQVEKIRKFGALKRIQKPKQPVVKITIFVPHANNPGTVHRTQLSVPKSILGNVLIAKALRLYHAETGMDISMNLDDYDIRAAESDGRVDSSWPEFEKNTAILSLECKNFVLVADKMKKDQKNVSKFLDYIRLNVIMPGEDFLSAVSVNVSPDILIRDLLRELERQLSLERDQYAIQLVKDNGKRCSVTPAMKYRTLRFLEVSCVALLRKFKPKRKEKKPTSPSNEFTIPVTTIDYTTYRVIKINKYGMRQSRILGIDSHALYNNLSTVKDAKTLLLQNFGLNRHRQVRRPIETLVSVERHKTNALAFTTTFDNHEVMHWEAKTRIEAEQIVTTLQYLMKIHQQDESRPLLSKISFDDGSESL